MTALSVTVITSPGREAQLTRCLEMLCRQSWPDFEVLLIDDGSAGGEAIARAYLSRLSLRYHWRVNDQCPARSRNLGASLARHAGLVFLDGDILLNPQALTCYAGCLTQALTLAPGSEPAAVYGSTGNTPHVSRSLWFDTLPVLIYDSRFCFVSRERMIQPPELLRYPQRYAWSGSFAIPASQFQRVGGFDESFRGWGYEDIDFARRLTDSGLRLDFCLNAWGEHQLNTSQWRRTASAEQQARAEIQEPAQHTPHVLYQEAFSQLGEHLAGHYLPWMSDKPPTWRA